MSVAGNGAPGSEAADDVPRQNHAEPRVMDGSSSSKVTVEYHDPSGLFPLIEEQLTSHFPLRNLHWKSPNRPLRSIDSLHVDLVPSEKSVRISGVTSPGLPPDGSQTLAAPGLGHRAMQASTEILKPPSKERRHQIPGLRQTPYLKVFLLRCDDSDTYKSTARKVLREWVKTHTPPSQSSSSASTQENHDAFEWMIVHVVIPDTQAASQPRGSTAAAASTGEKEKSTATSRWTRGTTTILEKIKADFNISSKSAPDRVSQIRLQKGEVPVHMLPSGLPSTLSITETAEEQERAWNDVIVKFKTLILLSFDLRVRQYEEDIREKESQRVLPGWNFCTFFILKEGLARGFESVGLVEDALLGYDELSVGLDSVILDQAKDGSGIILDHTEDLFRHAAEIYQQAEENGETEKEQKYSFHDSRPIDSRKKNYRDLILSNKISVFDFRCYIFARQMSLLLRLGNAQSARSDLASKHQPRRGSLNRSTSVDDVTPPRTSKEGKDDPEDLFSLADLCSRALNFITFAGRLLQDDLAQGAKAHDIELPQHVIENMEQSWTYAALQQVLEETSSTSLPISKSSTDASGDHSKDQKLKLADSKTMRHPKRQSSLRYSRSSSAEPSYSQSPASGQVVYENGQFLERTGPGKDNAALQGKNGLQELAGTRAHLYAVQRRILEHIGKALGWSVGWAAVLSQSAEQGFAEVDLNDSPASGEKETCSKATQKYSSVGLSAAAIVAAISSIDEFRLYYEALSDIIVKHYMAAGQVKAAETVLGDLAALRYEVGDYAAASMYFGRMASSFAESRWNLVESTMLRLHAQCLKKLNRKDEYVRTLLDLLMKSAAEKKQFRTGPKRVAGVSGNWLDDDALETSGILSGLIEYSEQLPYDRTVAMNHFFDDIAVEPYVRHYEDRDGFQLRLQFRHLLEDDVTFDYAKIRLINATNAQAKEIWLESAGPLVAKKGVCRTWLGCNVNATGPYTVDRILLGAKRIVFSHELFAKTEETTPLGIITSVSAATLKAAKKARVYCFPRLEAFDAKLRHSHSVHVDQKRSLELELCSGWNEIKSVEIHLRAGTAGLRLRTANATTNSDDLEVRDHSSPGLIVVGKIAKDTSATMQIPYDFETLFPELLIKAEIEYSTDKGTFLYLSSFDVPVDLPLDVNVHDHFKSNALFSKFNIKSASHVPLEVLAVGLEGSDEYAVQGPCRPKGSVHVFPRQPLAMTYKIMTKDGPVATKKKPTSSAKEGSLALSVTYRCVDEDALDRLRELFAGEVAKSPIHHLARLLIPSFVEGVARHILPLQFEKMALLERVDIVTYEALGWAECIETLPPTIRGEAEEWLRNWHTQHRTISLPSAPPSDTQPPTPTAPSTPPTPAPAPPSPRPPREIIITVSIPQIHILHTASLTLANLPQAHTSSHTPIATTGQPITATLRITHTRQWAPRAALPSLAHTAPLDFIYTLDCAPDAWLIAGPRRAQFSASEGEAFATQVVLVPMRVGDLLLPSVEVRATGVKGEKERESATGNGGEEKLVVETDYLSYGEVVRVVPDVRRSTVGVGELGVGAGAGRSVVWLEGVGMGDKEAGAEV